MAEQTVIHSTFVIERNYPQSPARVFAAFADAAKKRRWFGEGEHHTLEQFEMDFRVGGAERTRYRFNEGGPVGGMVISSEGSFQDIVPNQRIVTTSTMTLAGAPISSALVTIELLPTDAGTDLICTHQGVFYEGADGPQMREAGWRKLFEKLSLELTP